MEYDITDTIADFVRKDDSNFERELEEQEAALRRLKCINPYYGDWLDMGVDLLFSIFKLEDHAFARRVPELAHLSKSTRRRFLKHLETHLRDCDPCALKRRYALALDASIEKACCDNGKLLIQQLEEELRDSSSHVDEPTESYLCASTTAIDTSGARQSRYQYRQHFRRDTH